MSPKVKRHVYGGKHKFNLINKLPLVEVYKNQLGIERYIENVVKMSNLPENTVKNNKKIKEFF